MMRSVLRFSGAIFASACWLNAPVMGQVDEAENEPALTIPFFEDWEASETAIVGSVADWKLPSLNGGIIVRLELPPAGESVTVAVPLLEYKNVHLELRPISIREDGYELRAQIADGSWQIIEAGPEKTYTGGIREVPDAEVAASLLSNGLFASVFMPDGSRRWIEPLSEYIADADPALHVVYHGNDTACEGICGTDDLPGGGHGGIGDEGGTRGGCGGSLCIAQVACDADWQYYDSRGSSVFETQDRISAIINVINHQYVREVAITHRITTILVRTAEPDPYTSFDPGTLLDQFQAEWQNNQGGITRDLAHLFTGRELTGSVIGIAWVADICTSQSYGLSESNFSNTFACVTDLTAHEMGHNWGANHCTCPESTMNPSITCSNTFLNSGGQSTSEIDAYSDTRACLSAGAAPPSNDTCSTATYIYSYGTYAGTNVNATTDGGHTTCPPAGGGTYDVWWRFSPPASGTVSIDTCGSAFDTVLSVHNSCPGTPDNLVTCNDDCSSGDCTGTLQSCVSFSALVGRIYYIRVASYFGATGAVTLHISGPANPFGNSVCANAPTVTDGQTVFGSLFATGNDGDATCGSSSTNRDVWYQFTAPCAGTLVVDSCGTNDFPAEDLGTDTVLSLHTACVGTVANQITCNDDYASCAGAGGSNYDSRVTANLTAGQNVKIRVSHFGSSFNNGYFRIHVDFTVTPSAPVITAIPNASIPAGVAYVGPLPTLTNPTCMGSATWTLVTGPAGMTINASNGRVNWPNPVVPGSPHLVNIRATTSAGTDTEAWTLTVTAGCPLAGCDSGGSDADLNNDCEISLADLTILLANFGGPGPAGDINGNGSVGLEDLTIILSRFGNICH